MTGIRLSILTDEGLRLFFPLAALHAILWLPLWTLAQGFEMPLSDGLSPFLWHGSEMIFGTYGAALIGFITTAVPEWTGTERLRGRALVLMAMLWAASRLAGFLGGTIASAIAAISESLWLATLVIYVVWTWLRRPHIRLSVVVFWLSLLACSGVVMRVAFFLGDLEVAEKALNTSGLVFVGLLGVILARISVPVTNRVLDATGATSPFRPHPGRIHLAPGLTFLAVAAFAVDMSATATAYLLIAAGAAFLDRVSEAFIGPEFFRTEILFLALPAAFAGTGLLLAGASRLDMPVAEMTALHVAFVGGLGMGVLGVFSIAGLMHTARTFPLPRAASVAMILMVSAVALRTLPSIFSLPNLLISYHGLASLSWAAAFFVWLRAYWPFLSTPRITNQSSGGELQVASTETNA